MSVRDHVRALRLYYRSLPLIRRAFGGAVRAAWFPLFGRGVFQPRGGGAPVIVPRRCWTMLPSASRLVLAGARPEWRDDALHIEFGDLRLVGPAADKSLAFSFIEIFINDVYRLADLDLAGRTVLDVGANVGDSSVAFAMRGAHVHAFEPLPSLQRYLERNTALNGLGDRITVHAVALSDRDATATVRVRAGGSANASCVAARAEPRHRADNVTEEMRLVEAGRYLADHGIAHADVIKLDCEGCEYALLRNTDLLRKLRPQRIVLEYHMGGAELAADLGGLGYRVDWPQPEAAVGYLYAQRVKG